MSEKNVGRRWFRFSLRTLFVVVSVLCCWLAWETNVVRQRRAVLAEMKGKSFQFTRAAEYAKRAYPPGATMPEPAKVSLVRTLLGDEAIQEIWYTTYTQGYSASDLARLKKTFPEAQFSEVHPEPCHPGCFPRGTLVDTPGGPRPIEGILAGEYVTAILPSGETVAAQVQSVFVTDNRLWKVETEEGPLLTTETQPLCLAAQKILQAGKLQPGDMILRRQGEEIQSVQVLGVSPTERREKVFNLILGDSDVFVANGFLARSKPPAETAARSNQR